MKYFVDPPGEPKGVEISNYDRNSVTLAWKPPDDDGGNPIQGTRYANSNAESV